MLTIVKKQQQQIDKLLKQNDKLIKSLGKLEIGAAKKKRPDNRNRDRLRLRGGKNRNGRPAPEEIAQAAADAAAPAADGAEWSPKCGVCGGRHPTHKCWELAANADSRPANWRSIFE